MVKLPSRRFIP